MGTFFSITVVFFSGTVFLSLECFFSITNCLTRTSIELFVDNNIFSAVSCASHRCFSIICWEMIDLWFQLALINGHHLVDYVHLRGMILGLWQFVHRTIAAARSDRRFIFLRVLTSWLIFVLVPLLIPAANSFSAQLISFFHFAGFLLIFLFCNYLFASFNSFNPSVNFLLQLKEITLRYQYVTLSNLSILNSN